MLCFHTFVTAFDVDIPACYDQRAVGMDSVVNPEDRDYPLYQYLASDDARFEKLLEIPEMLRTPIVRNGKKATVGYCPDVWKDWD